MALTTLQKLNIASISEYLAFVDIDKKGLYGGGVPINLPQKIYTIRKSIAYWYSLDPTESTLVATSNYLLALCGLYGLEAQEVTGGGGTITPITPVTAPLPLQFIVAASGTTFIDGQSSATLTQFIGFNILFARGNVTQSTVDTEPTYYSFNKTTGVLTLNIAATTGELFQIYPL